MDDRTSREEALRKVLAQHPELSSSNDPADLAHLNDLVEAQEREDALQREVEDLRRREFAEEARQKGLEAKRQRAEQEQARQRVAAEERAARLAQMGPLRRLVAKHPLAVGVGVVVLVAAVGLGVAAAVRSTGEMGTPARVESGVEAQAREVAERQAEQAAQDVANQAAEDRLQELRLACDPSMPESELSVDVWAAWMACEDREVSDAAYRRVSGESIDADTLLYVAKNTVNPDAAALVSTRQETPAAAHTVLVQRWGPEIVGASYTALYGQPCGPAQPWEVLVDTQWRSSDGVKLFLAGKDPAARPAEHPCNAKLVGQTKGSGDGYWRQVGRTLYLELDGVEGRKASAFVSYRVGDEKMTLLNETGGQAPDVPEVFVRQ